jgi:signal transduction histidine kinase
VGALFDAMEQLRDEAPALSAKARQALRVIERNLRAITAVGAVVRKEAPVREAWASLDPARLAREVVAQLGLPEACVRVEGKPQLWELARDYVALALDNLLRNAIEAYARRGLPVPEPPVEVCVRYGCGEIRVRDRAGGIDPKLGDIFLPYVSEKGIRQNAGLGLTQAREALDLVGGRLELAGVQPEGGAEFVMTM